MPHRNLIIDTNNLAFIMRHSKVKTPTNLAHKESMIAEFIFLNMLLFILSFAKNNKIDSLVICLEGTDVWRKGIYPEYKANREYDEDAYYSEVLRGIDIFQSYMREHTAATVLKHNKMEADDLIAVWCQMSEGVENVILSSDNDFIQLTDDHTSCYSPHVKDWLTADDVMFSLFVKCIRGDRNDNIRSAYPRVRLTTLQEAWEDSYKMINLLETIMKDGKKVNDTLEFNMKLIDLKSQPQQYRDEVLEMIDSYAPGAYNLFDTLRYLKNMGLKDMEQNFKFSDNVLKTKSVFNCNK